MSTISQYAFTNQFNTDKLTTRQVVEIGAQSYVVTAADTNGDGELSFEEIISNTELCNKIFEYMQSAKLTVTENATKDPQQAVPPKEPTVSYEA